MVGARMGQRTQDHVDYPMAHRNAVNDWSRRLSIDDTSIRRDYLDRRVAARICLEFTPEACNDGIVDGTLCDIQSAIDRSGNLVRRAAKID